MTIRQTIRQNPQTPTGSTSTQPEQRQVTSNQTRHREKEELDPTVRNLISRGWSSITSLIHAVRWQDARRKFERAFQLNSRSTEARIGLACGPLYQIGGRMVACATGRLAAGGEYIGGSRRYGERLGPIGVSLYSRGCSPDAEPDSGGPKGVPDGGFAGPDQRSSATSSRRNAVVTG